MGNGNNYKGLSDGELYRLLGKEREKTATKAARRRHEITRSSSARGWFRPTGEDDVLLRQAEELSISDDQSTNREIVIAEANLRLQNLQFSITQAIGFEGQLINLHNSEQQRRFEAARYTIEAAIALYGLEVSYFNANVAMFEAMARVYQSRLQAQLTEVEVYKAQLEGQRLVGDLNKQDIEIYRAKIDAVLATFDLYKSKLEGVKILLEGDALKLQRFESQIKGFSAEIQAKALENDIYKSQLSGEEIKVSMYGKLSDAFNSRMQGYKVETDAKVAKQESDIKVAYDVPLKVGELKTEIFKSLIGAEAERLKALTGIYETRGNVFESLMKGESEKVNAEVQIQKNEIEKQIAEANIRIEVMKANVATTLAQKEMLISIQETITKVRAQLTAAYGSAINYSAGIDAGINYGDTHHTSHTYGLSESV